MAPSNNESERQLQSSLQAADTVYALTRTLEQVEPEDKCWTTIRTIVKAMEGGEPELDALVQYAVQQRLNTDPGNVKQVVLYNFIMVTLDTLRKLSSPSATARVSVQPFPIQLAAPDEDEYPDDMMDATNAVDSQLGGEDYINLINDSLDYPSSSTRMRKTKLTHNDHIRCPIPGCNTVVLTMTGMRGHEMLHLREGSIHCLTKNGKHHVTFTKHKKIDTVRYDDLMARLSMCELANCRKKLENPSGTCSHTRTHTDVTVSYRCTSCGTIRMSADATMKHLILKCPLGDYEATVNDVS